MTYAQNRYTEQHMANEYRSKCEQLKLRITELEKELEAALAELEAYKDKN